jgi:ankyrin repeat protein
VAAITLYFLSKISFTRQYRQESGTLFQRYKENVLLLTLEQFAAEIEANPSSLNETDQNGRTLLHWGVQRLSHQRVFLMAKIMDEKVVNLKDKSGKTAFDYAITHVNGAPFLMIALLSTGKIHMGTNGLKVDEAAQPGSIPYNIIAAYNKRDVDASSLLHYAKTYFASPEWIQELTALTAKQKK